MNYGEQVAHHEAAHVVVSRVFGGGPTLHGIDIHAVSSVAGASGNAGVGLLIQDVSLPEKEQRDLLVQNVAIICAGAASDARTMKRNVNDALQRQPGDLAVAKAEISKSPLVSGDEEAEYVLLIGLQKAQACLANSDVWDAVVKVAQACLANGGKLSQAEIEALLSS